MRDTTPERISSKSRTEVRIAAISLRASLKRRLSSRSVMSCVTPTAPTNAPFLSKMGVADEEDRRPSAVEALDVEHVVEHGLVPV